MWLGVLGAVQRVRLGVLLLHRLSRVDGAAMIVLAHLLACIIVIVSCATLQCQHSNNAICNFELWNLIKGVPSSDFARLPFWVANLCQIAIGNGYVYIFRSGLPNKPPVSSIIKRPCICSGP